MPRKTFKTINSLIKNTKTLITTHSDEEPCIPDILQFCYDPAYLGFLGLPTPIKLYPVQELILKCFYRGSEGNEHLQLTEDDIRLCQDKGLIDKKNGNIVDKWNSGELFRELVLVWGRRSGKDFTISIIALYEAMRLLESPSGDPYKRYNLASAAPFTILTIANSQQQARILYTEIREKFMLAPYFRDKFKPEGLTQDMIYMLTPKDKQVNAEFAAKGWPEKLGSVRVVSGHSNSDSLLGMGCYVLLLDEVASFKTTGGSSSGDRIYTALTPSTKTYARLEPRRDLNGDIMKDEGGKAMMRTVYDGKIISISSPRGMDGVFWNLYNSSDRTHHTLCCRLPTWQVNINQQEQDLRDSEPLMTEERFRMEYGAEFSGTEGENFFPPESVEKCFANNYPDRTIGEPGKTYFAHLDPAKSSHNYVLAIVHKEHYINPKSKQIDYYIVLDHMKIWSPKDGQPIQLDQVDDYMLWINKRFHLSLVTYDQWNTSSWDTRIPSYHGLYKAIDLQIGDQVYSRHGQLQSIVAKQVDLGADCLKIRTKFGYEVTVTHNHPFWNGTEFVFARDCVVGNRLDIQDFQHFGTKNDPESARLMGYLISEGYINETETRVEFSNTDEEVLCDYASVGEDVTGIVPKKYQYLKQQSHHLDAWKMVYTSDQAEKLRDLGMKGDCYTKEVPSFVMQGDQDTVAAFLSALYEGDGNLCKNPNALLIEYNTSSEMLARDIHLLLLNFGIKSSLKFYSNKFSPQGKHCPFYRISIYGENIDIFASEIGFRSSRKKAELAEVLRLKNDMDLRSRYNHKNRGIRKITSKKSSRSRQMWDRIVSIEPCKSTICHLEVSGDHTYISNGLVSHNSQHSVNKLRRAGIPAMETIFNKNYKIKIYDELYALVTNGEQKLKLPPMQKLLRNEMLNLQRKFMNQGYRIYPKTDGECKTDDCCDALAGACFNALKTDAQRLPQAALVNTGFSNSGNNVLWRSMQGTPYGYGPGNQVAANLERRSKAYTFRPWS